MNHDRTLAVRRLEKALKACKAANLAIIGMDDTLYAYAIEDLEATGLDIYGYEAKAKAGNTPIEDHGAYWESGGW